MPVYRADLHIHTDGPFEDDGRICRGLDPLDAGSLIASSNLDVVAITNHGQTKPDAFFPVKNAVAAHDSFRRPNRERLIFLGVEMQLVIEEGRFNVGYVFEKPYHHGNWPEFPAKGAPISELEQYKKEYPGVAILNHPHSRGYDSEIIHTAIQHPLIDGVEIMNASQVMDSDPRRLKNAWEDLTLEAAIKGQKSPIGGSGLHDASGHLIGNVYTTFTALHPVVIFHAIRNCTTQALCADPIRDRLSLPHDY
ncbi:hypothetical protein IPJ72_06345 [Candidatus Peregrinibacteria bacterium]|nr:MAG: hypothetical protein IPJ72_06345 [Candidatus Peregrinibacteria bacterium]